MQLYYADKTISIAVAIGLFEAGIEFEPVRVDFAAAEQTKPPYHAINPKGRVPALVGDHGILTETGALLDYVATLAPEAGLVPSDPLKAARMREVMYYLASTMHVNHAHKVRGERWVNDAASIKDMQAKVPETMTASARFIEENALAGPYVLGDAISMADPYLYVVCTWLEGDGVAVSDFPIISAFMEAMNGRGSVQAARKLGML
ncbi:glutathione S-transferase family protein [Arenibacterium sp. CAU 1754]